MPSIHTVEDEDPIPPNHAQEIPNDDPQPSRNPQRKPSRRVFGIQQRAFQVGGMLPWHHSGSFRITYREQRERYV